jgi:hypothetical protein
MFQVNKNQKLKMFLEQLCGKKLSDEEVREQKERLVKFFGLLVDIDMRNKKKGK